MRLLVIVPAYNEAGSILRVTQELRETCPQFDYVVINDGSTDNTEEICRENHIPVISLPVNLGLSAAVGTGMKYADRNGYDAAVQLDGDGQHRPEYLPAMLEKISAGYDIVIGSRYVTEKKPMTIRMIGNRLIAVAIRLTTGQKMSDPTSGLRMYSRRIIHEFATEINHPPEPDTISYLMRKGAKMTELQVVMDEREQGKSYFNFTRSAAYMLRMGISIMLVQWFRGREFEKERTKMEENRK